MRSRRTCFIVEQSSEEDAVPDRGWRGTPPLNRQRTGNDFTAQRSFPGHWLPFWASFDAVLDDFAPRRPRDREPQVLGSLPSNCGFWPEDLSIQTMGAVLAKAISTILAPTAGSTAIAMPVDHTTKSDRRGGGGTIPPPQRSPERLITLPIESCCPESSFIAIRTPVLSS
jgi:hypothetical protein